MRHAAFLALFIGIVALAGCSTATDGQVAGADVTVSDIPAYVPPDAAAIHTVGLDSAGTTPASVNRAVRVDRPPASSQR